MTAGKTAESGLAPQIDTKSFLPGAVTLSPTEAAINVSSVLTHMIFFLG
jgi:hypothetical protein